MYPNGNKKDSGSGYLSLYVAIDNSTLVGAQQEVLADLRFYVFNNNERKYFTIQGFIKFDLFFLSNIKFDLLNKINYMCLSRLPV